MNLKKKKKKDKINLVKMRQEESFVFAKKHQQPEIYRSPKGTNNVLMCTENFCCARETFWWARDTFSCSQESVFKAFEGEQVDRLKLLDSMVSLIKSVSSRELNPLANVDVLKGPTDGYISPKPHLCYFSESKASELHLAPEDENSV